MARGLQPRGRTEIPLRGHCRAKRRVRTPRFPAGSHPARPPRPPGAQDLSGFGTEPSGFAKLLDGEHESHTKPDRHDNAGPVKGSRRSNAAHAKHATDNARAQHEAPTDATSQAAAEETPEDAAQQTSGDTSKDAEQKASTTADATPNGETAQTGTDASIAAVDATVLTDARSPSRRRRSQPRRRQP